MAKRKKKDAAEGEEQTGRQSTIKVELPSVPQDEKNARFEMAQQIAQELHDVERKLERRNIERLELKAKLDKVSDDQKSLEARTNAMRREIVEVLEGRSTGRLPFGAGVGAAKPVTVDQLKTTPAKLAECYYGRDVLGAIMASDRPAVNRAITLEHSDLRFILIDADHGMHRLLALHPSGWIAPSSGAALTGLTGLPVEFMDATLVVGTADESPIVMVELPGTAKHGSGGRTDPGGATRGAAVDRAKQHLGESLDKLLMEWRVAGHIEQPTDEDGVELQSLALLSHLASAPNPRRWLALANLDDYERIAAVVEAATAERAKWFDTAEAVKGIVTGGIPDANPDDFDILDDDQDAGDAQGDAEQETDAGDANDAPEDENEDEGDDQDAGADAETGQDGDGEGSDDPEAAEGAATGRKSPGKRPGKKAKKSKRK